MPDIKRVLWITQRHEPLTGGMANSSTRLVRGLRRSGVWTDVVALKEGRAGDVEFVYKDNGVDIWVTYEKSFGNGARAAFEQVIMRHSEGPYDVVVGFGVNRPGMVATTVARWLDLPVAVMVRGNDFDRDWFEPAVHGFVRFSLEHANAIGSVTREKIFKIKKLLDIPQGRFVWTPNGVDPLLWQVMGADLEKAMQIRREIVGDDDSRRVIGLFGELKFKKQTSMFLEVIIMERLQNKICLLIVGSIDDATRQILEDPGLGLCYKYHRFVSHQDMVPFYRASDYVAIASMFDGFPNVLLEAMAVGVVPVCSDAGAMGEVLTHGDTAFLFKAGNKIGARGAIKEAMDLDYNELKSMKGRVQRFVIDNFNTDNELKHLFRLLHRAIGDFNGL